LSTILGTPTSMKDSSKMEGLIIKELKSLEGVKYSVDKTGNISATKGESTGYAAFVCHTDVVADIPQDFKVSRLNYGVWVGHTTVDGEEQRIKIGGDKIGIFLCLKILRVFENVKCVFFTDEVPNSQGIRKFDIDFFNDCKYIIGLDLPGHDKIVTCAYGQRLGNYSFEADLNKLGKKHGYAVENVSATHLYPLRDKPSIKTSMALISVGFWDQYNTNEHVVEMHVNKAYNFCMQIDSVMNTKYIHHWEDRFEQKKLLAPATSLNNFGQAMCATPSCKSRLMWAEKKFCMVCVNDRIRERVKCEECAMILLHVDDVCSGLCARCRVDPNTGGKSASGSPNQSLVRG